MHMKWYPAKKRDKVLFNASFWLYVIVSVTGLSRFSNALQHLLQENTISSENQSQHLNALKMLCYLVCQLADGFEAEETKVGIAQVGTLTFYFLGIIKCIYSWKKKKKPNGVCLDQILVTFISILFYSLLHSLLFIFLMKEIVY